MLAVFFGDGRAAEEVYDTLTVLNYAFLPIDLGSSGRLHEARPDIVRMSPLDLDGMARLFRDYGITQACFVGPVYRSIGWRDVRRSIDLIRYRLPRWSQHRKLPHALLLIMMQFFEAQGVELVPQRRLLPGLVGASGDSIGDPPDHPFGDLVSHARLEVNDPRRQSWLWITQSHVYRRLPDAQRFELHAREAFGTDQLVRRVRDRRRPGDRSTYLLVKVALDVFDGIEGPGIGEDTVRNCIDAGIAAAALEADRILVFQRSAVEALCRRTGFSVVFV